MGINKGDDIEVDWGDFITFGIAIVLFFMMLIILTYLKYKRLKREHERWLDIKELEKDYDVFVTDEYAHQISDIKVQLQYLNDLNHFSSVYKGQESGLPIVH